MWKSARSPASASNWPRPPFVRSKCDLNLTWSKWTSQCSPLISGLSTTLHSCKNLTSTLQVPQNDTRRIPAGKSHGKFPETQNRVWCLNVAPTKNAHQYSYVVLLETYTTAQSDWFQVRWLKSSGHFSKNFFFPLLALRFNIKRPYRAQKIGLNELYKLTRSMFSSATLPVASYSQNSDFQKFPKRGSTPRSNFPFKWTSPPGWVSPFSRLGRKQSETAHSSYGMRSPCRTSGRSRHSMSGWGRG